MSVNTARQALLLVRDVILARRSSGAPSVTFRVRVTYMDPATATMAAVSVLQTLQQDIGVGRTAPGVRRATLLATAGPETLKSARIPFEV